MRLGIPFVMIVMIFGAGCSELPPRERDDRRDAAAAEAAEHSEGQLISPMPLREDDGDAEEGEARYD